MLADTIKTARGIIEKGWCKGTYTDQEGNFCTYGAVFQAEGVTWHTMTGIQGVYPVISPHAAVEANHYLRDLVQKMGYKDVPTFNDDPNTTHQDVLNFFDKALAELGAL
jgi:hypothetical protein